MSDQITLDDLLEAIESASDEEVFMLVEMLMAAHGRHKGALEARRPTSKDSRYH